MAPAGAWARGGQLGKGEGQCGWQCGVVGGSVGVCVPEWAPHLSPLSPEPDAPVIMQICCHINPSTLGSTLGGFTQQLQATEDAGPFGPDWSREWEWLV